MRMRHPFLPITAFLFSVGVASNASAAPKTAKKPAAGAKAPSACGIKFLPLAVGNSWTYTPGIAPIALPPVEEKQSPLAIKKIVIKVAAIDVKPDKTVVSLEEQIGERKLTTTITCSVGKIDLSPDAFWFGGEPGGFLGMEMTKFDRKGTTWVLTDGTVGEAQWREDFVAQWKRVPAKGTNAPINTGKLEVERQFTPAVSEDVSTPLGQMKAEKLAISVTGRVTIDGATADAKPYPLKANLINSLWLVDGIGVVQVLNSYAHLYVLSETNIAK
jgi:hypothetical protein